MYSPAAFSTICLYCGTFSCCAAVEGGDSAVNQPHLGVTCVPVISMWAACIYSCFASKCRPAASASTAFLAIGVVAGRWVVLGVLAVVLCFVSWRFLALLKDFGSGSKVLALVLAEFTEKNCNGEVLCELRSFLFPDFCLQLVPDFRKVIY